MEKPADYHIHTALCKHAWGAPAEYVGEASKNGLTEICFTDHVPAPGGYDAESRMSLEDFPRYCRDIAGIPRTGTPAILQGMEADFYAGSTEFLSSWLPRQSFDLVLGAVHFIDDWGFDNESHKEQWDKVDVLSVWKKYFSLVRQLAETRLYDIVAHLDLPKKFGFRPSEKEQCTMAAPALDAIADAGMALEINTGGLRKPIREIYPALPLLTLARERNIPITFGSDAHRPEETGYAFDEACGWARSAGYTHYTQFRQRKKQQVLIPLTSG